MNYTELKSRVAGWTHRTDLDSLMPTFVEHAETRLNRDLRVRQMEASITPTVISASNTITLPVGFLAAKSVWISGYPHNPLTAQTQDTVRQQRRTSGPPCMYAVTEDAMLFDGSGTVEMTYYESIPGIVANTSNWLSNAHPDLYLHAVLAAVAEYTRDSGAGALSDAKAQTLIETIQNTDKRDRLMGRIASVKR